jgi:methylenetetrahydrofolate reductase (NADPH)
MKVIDIIHQAKRPLFTYELLPPLKGKKIESIFTAIEKLQEFEPAYINFTYHQQEEVYRQRPDGLMERHIIRKRPGTVALSAAVKARFNIEVVPHLLCGGFSREETEDALIELHFLGIDNVFALRGDPPHGQKRFTPHMQGHVHTNELVEQIICMNEGRYLEDAVQNPDPTNFCVGVAGYPEKHVESPNFEHDLKMLKQKVEAGADYIVTQMFFINQRFFDFVDICRKVGINVPIIPGIKPLSRFSDLELLPQTFNIDLPEDLVDAVASCRTNAEVREVGVEFAIEQSRQLIAGGAPGIHYYTLGKANSVVRIAREVF